jgi:hypothetical protein
MFSLFKAVKRSPVARLDARLASSFYPLMPWTAIVKMSLDDDYGSKIRAKVVAQLEAAGFRKVGTGHWEVKRADEEHASVALANTLTILADPQGYVKGASGGLDSLKIEIRRS